MDLNKALDIAVSGMNAQGTRLRVIAENLANSSSTAGAPGEEPYRRKVVTFRNHLDKTLGVDLVDVDQIKLDQTDFKRHYEPGNPSADSDGYVLYPNVNPIIETMDMQEAQRSYEANMTVLDSSKTLLLQTISMLK